MILKKKRNLLICLIVFILIFLLSACQTNKFYKYNGETYDDSYDYKDNYGYIYLKNKNEVQAKLYEDLYLNMVDFSHKDLDVEEKTHRELFFKEDINNTSITREEIEQVFIYMNIENPAFYWLSCSDDDNNLFCIGVRSEYMKKSVRRKIRKEINDGTKSIDKLINGIEDEYEKIKTLADYIMDNMSYAYTDGVASEEAWAHNIVGFFEKNKGVCETYAKIFKYYCDRYNIGNIPVVSVDHIWNIVLYENSWYVFDLTWDEKTYTYFGKTEDVYKMDSGRTESHDYDPLLYVLPENMAITPLSLGLIELKENNNVLAKSHNIDSIVNKFYNGNYEIILNNSDDGISNFYISNIDSNYNSLFIRYIRKGNEKGILNINKDINLAKDITFENVYLNASSSKKITLNENTIYLKNVSIGNLVAIEGDNIIYID